MVGSASIVSRLPKPRLGARRREEEFGDLESRLIWIMGSPRSGSTWLLNLLALDAQVVKCDEPGIGSHLAVSLSAVTGMRPLDVPASQSRLNDFRRTADDYFFAARYRSTWEPNLRALLLARFDAHMRDKGNPTGKFLLIKEPHGSLGADVLLSTLPRSKLLFLLRDGRDVVDSELDAASAGAWGSSQLEGYEASDLDRRGYIRDRAHAWRWKTAIVDQAYRAHPPHLRRLARYEDLREQPQKVLSEVAEWIGLDIGADRIRDRAHRLSFENLPPEQRGSGKFARAATPGLWRQNLSLEEQRLLTDIIGDELRKHGYE